MEFKSKGGLAANTTESPSSSAERLDGAPEGLNRRPGPGRSNFRKAFETWLDALTLSKLLILLTLVSLLLRITYTGYLFEDDGLWFTAAEQLLRGKALYREIYFDKPPLLPLTYALLFKAFGAHILVIRLFTVFLVTAICAVLYQFGSRLYDKRSGIISAALFTFFSTTGVSGHVQGLNTDFLMVLPYTAGAFLLTEALRATRPRSTKRWNDSQLLMAAAGGALTGMAIQTNPKGIFNFAFFALLLTIAVLARPSRGSAKSGFGAGRAIALLGIAAGGALVATIPFAAYLAITKSFSHYIAYVWAWGFRYAAYFSPAQSVATGARVIFSYLALNSVLTLALAFFLVKMSKRIAGEKHQGYAALMKDGDFILFTWFACSFAGMAVGGRFYTHYIFEMLPALCIVGARGLLCIGEWATAFPVSTGRRYARRILLSALALGFLVTLVRFHTRTAVLALDWLRGSKSESTERWFHEILNREERMAAGIVGELPGGPDEAMRLPPEAIRELRHTPEKARRSPSDYLFVWGYRPEVYYWSGLMPASRFISIQEVTGIPADVQYINGNSRSVLPDIVRGAAMDQLLRDLEETKPQYVVDEVGMFNSALVITSYPGIGEFMRDYRQVEATGRLMVYHRRDPLKKSRRRNIEEQDGAVAPKD